MSDLRRHHFQEIAPTLAGKRAAVFNALAKFGPSTAKELAERIEWHVCSVRPRLTELRDAERIRSTGERRDDQHVFEVCPVAVKLEQASLAV